MIDDKRIAEIQERYDGGRPIPKTDVKYLLKEIDRLDFVIIGIMHSVDKWLDDDELNEKEEQRALTMREKTLRIVEDLQGQLAESQRREQAAVEDLSILKRCAMCKRDEDDTCGDYEGCNFLWRGPQES